MSFDLIVVIGAVAFITGVILTLNYMGKRPINVNVSAHAEAHGGNASSTPSSAPPVASGGGVGLLKFLVGAAIAVFALILIAGLIGRIGESAKVTVNVPEQRPMVVNVPKSDPPVINVTPQVPVTVAPSMLETVLLLIGGVASIVTIGVCALVLRRLWAQDQVVKPVVQQPIEYIRTSYGWTPKRVKESDPIPAEQVAPGLFTQKPE